MIRAASHRRPVNKHPGNWLSSLSGFGDVVAESKRRHVPSAPRAPAGKPPRSRPCHPLTSLAGRRHDLNQSATCRRPRGAREIHGSVVRPLCSRNRPRRASSTGGATPTSLSRTGRSPERERDDDRFGWPEPAAFRCLLTAALPLRASPGSPAARGMVPKSAIPVFGKITPEQDVSRRARFNAVDSDSGGRSDARLHRGLSSWR